jgi:predicted RNA-binding Zn-ribbon protein involved in translation (DUF1610 family)
MPIPSTTEIIKLIKTGATIEAQEKIMELRQALMDAQEETLRLRGQVQTLESKLKQLEGPSLPRCPKCGKPAWSLKSTAPDPIFGPLGGMRRKYECGECGFVEDALETPGR